MLSQICRRSQPWLLFAILCLFALPGSAQEGDGFESVGDFPWVGYVGPLSDGLHGLRFGMGGFDVNRVMQDKGLASVNSRPHTLRFDGAILGSPAELVAGFTRARPSDPDAQLRVVQIRWRFRGLPQTGFRAFEKLDRMLATRYGRPVLERDDGIQQLENGQGRHQRLYYGPQARAWIEYAAVRRQDYALLIRIECPQLPKPEDE